MSTSPAFRREKTRARLLDSGDWGSYRLLARSHASWVYVMKVSPARTFTSGLGILF
jgi:hypothetical protein